jgi:membrane dipeptidase
MDSQPAAIPGNPTRRRVLQWGAQLGGGAALGLLAGGLAFPHSPALAHGLSDRQRLALEFLRGIPSIDVHSHPGGTFRNVKGWLDLSLDPAKLKRRIPEMKRGGLSAAFFNAVPDATTLGLQNRKLRSLRRLKPGEGYRNLQAQYGPVLRHIKAGDLLRIEEPADWLRAIASGVPGALIGVEGGDFLEGSLERLREVYAWGFRSVQLVHYTVNDLGDIQTEPPRHGGLTRFGRNAVQEMNRLGMVVDMAHATHDACKQAADASSHPLLLSHTLIGDRHARLISPRHARLIAQTGGVIGAWGLRTRRDSFSGYIQAIQRLVDVAGIGHVAIGSDMDGTPRAQVSYAQWYRLPEALLAKGFSREEVAKIMGGNFLRLFRAVRAGKG